MPRKHIEEVVRLSTIERLAPLSKIAHRRRVLAVGRLSPDLADDGSSILEEPIHGVREAKDSFSSLLNRASEGRFFFIKSGQGEPVVMVGADVLGEVFEILQRAQAVTLSDAWHSLPFKGTDLPAIHPRGRPRKHGLHLRTGD